MPEPDTSTKKQPSVMDVVASFLKGVQSNIHAPSATPAMMMPGHVGQIGQPFSPTLPSGLRLPSVMGAPSQMQPQPMQPTQPMQAFHFLDAKARDAAVASSALQNLSQVVTQYQNRKEQKTRAQAEGYMNQIIAFQQAGDTQGLNLLLEDPKVIKTLEKGLDYFMPKVPGEAPTPEAMGIHGAIKKMQGRLPAPNTPGGVAIPRMGETEAATKESQRLAAVAALKKLQQDPTLAAQQGLGTALSGEESARAARIASGLGLSASQYATLEAGDRKALQTFDMFKMEQENRLRELASQQATAKDVAMIHAGPLYERARILRELGHAQIKMREQFAKGKTADAMKTVMQTLSTQINTLHTNATKAEKDGNDDMATEYLKEANDLQKQYDDVKAASQFDVDSLIQSLLGPE